VCPKNEGPNTHGVCVTTTALYDTVDVGKDIDLDDALNRLLNKNCLHPTVNVVEDTTLDDNADMTGVSISGVSSGHVPLILVDPSVTLSITYDWWNNFRPTSIYNVEFRIESKYITVPLLEGAGISQSTVILNSVIISFDPSLNAPLILCVNFDNIQFTNLSVSRKNSSQRIFANTKNEAVAVMDNICGVWHDSPSFLVRNCIGIIINSVFTNIDTGIL
jgi:hypothetical protein